MIKKPVNSSQQLKNSLGSSQGQLLMLAHRKRKDSSLLQSQQHMEYQLPPHPHPNSQRFQSSTACDERQNQSIFSNVFQKKREETKKIREGDYLRTQQDQREEAEDGKSFGSLRGGKSTMMLSLCYSNESMNKAEENSNPSLLKSVRQSYPEQFLMREGEMERKCATGDMKKAKYRIKDTNSYYCSRCAILLLQEGHFVEELKEESFKENPFSVPPNNLEPLNTLFDRLDLAESRIQTTLKESEDQQIKSQIQSLCKDEIMLYDSVIEAMQQMKVQSVRKYERILTTVEVELRNEELQLLEKLDEIIKLRNQINTCSSLQPQNVGRYVSDWEGQIDNIEKFDRLEVKMKKQSVEEQLVTVVRNIYEYLNISPRREPSMASSLTASMMMREEESRNLFTKMLRESRQRV